MVTFIGFKPDTLRDIRPQGLQVDVGIIALQPDQELLDVAEVQADNVRVLFEGGSRFVFRLSGTGVAGATIRMYLEKYVPPTGDLAMHAFDVVKPIADVALAISGLAAATGRETPTVIT